jgi:hypothetical protein
MKNPNCDNDKCRERAGEVRLLPTGGGGNATVPATHPPEPVKLTEEQKAAAIANGFQLTNTEDK